jgi:hypothetical protein
VNRCLNN